MFLLQLFGSIPAAVLEQNLAKNASEIRLGQAGPTRCDKDGQVRWGRPDKQAREGAAKMVVWGRPDKQAREGRILAAGDYLADHFGESPVLAIFCFQPATDHFKERALFRG